MARRLSAPMLSRLSPAATLFAVLASVLAAGGVDGEWYTSDQATIWRGGMLSSTISPRAWRGPSKSLQVQDGGRRCRRRTGA